MAPRLLLLCWVAAVATVLSGCGGPSGEHSKEDFSKESFEKAMKESGQEKELEEYKKREAAYQQGPNAQPEGQQ